MEYEYKSINVLDNKISYSYSAFKGAAFIHDFMEYRLGFVKNATLTEEDKIHLLVNQLSPEHALSRTVNAWLKNIYASHKVDEGVYLLLKRFEVSKRIYAAYDENFRPLDKGSYHIYSLYLKFGYLLSSSFIATNGMQFLNALIKLNDILCSLDMKRNADEEAIFCYLINKEIHFINHLAESLEIKL